MISCRMPSCIFLHSVLEIFTFKGRYVHKYKIVLSITSHTLEEVECKIWNCLISKMSYFKITWISFILEDYCIFLSIYRNKMNVFVKTILVHDLFSQPFLCESPPPPPAGWAYQQYIKRPCLQELAVWWMRKTNKQTIKIKCYNCIIGKRKRRAIFERRRRRRKEEAEAPWFVGVFGLESVKTLGSEGPLTLHTPLSGSPG